MRPRTLTSWTIGATVILLGLGLHDALRDPIHAPGGPSFALVVFAALGLFIVHTMIAAGVRAGRVWAPYEVYFERAWSHALQIAIAAASVFIAWYFIHELRTALDAAGIDALDRIEREQVFFIPISTVITATAIHVADAHPAATGALRNALVTGLAWLLPLATALIVAGLLTLPFSGLAPLWERRSATALLLGACAFLVILLTAAYRDGGVNRERGAVTTIAGWVAAATLLPLSGLAAYALWLRITAQGLTPERVVAAACTLIAGAYALGYAASVLRPGRWLSALPRTNVAAAVLTVAVLFALFSLLADPARLSVADQLDRLEAGIIKPENFDFAFLRSGGAIYGRDALKTLAARTQGPNAAAIAERANAALAEPGR